MAKIKSNYLSGKYELTRPAIDYMGDYKEVPIIVDLTSAQAKCLFSKSLYDKLGFESIEYIGAE